MSKNQVAIQEKNITDNVLNRVNEMQQEKSIQIPENYSVSNALKSAYLILLETKDKSGKPVLESCTKESIYNSLLDMAVQGLNPSKKQCYFIAYGNKLTMSRSYLGTIALTKRIKQVQDVKGYALYKGDTFEMGMDLLTGKRTIKAYEPSVENIATSNLIGAFAIVIGEKEIIHVEYMTMEQIKEAWQMGSMNGSSKAHKNFPDQMAIKTVINRACKYYANTSDDDYIVELMSQHDEDRQVELAIETHANQEVLELPKEPLQVDRETGEILEEEKPSEIVVPF